MRRCLAKALGLFVLLGASVPAVTSEEPAYLVESLAEGVVLFRPAQANGAGANSLVVEQERGLVVVDAQPTTESARRLLSAIAARYDKPLRHLILSHAHAEAAGGASAFGDGVLVIVSSGAATELEDREHDFGAEVQARSTTPESWSAPPRPRPGLIISGRTDLADAMRPIQILPQGQAHTGGDIFVYLPKQGVMYIGGLLSSDRNPYARGGSLEGWTARLNDVILLGPEKVVGLTGSAVGPDDVRRQRDSLVWLRGEIEEGFAQGLTVAQIRRTVLMAESTGERFDAVASPSFLPLLVDQAIGEGLEHRRKRGVHRD